MISAAMTDNPPKTAQAANVPFLGALPFDPSVVEAADQGLLMELKEADSPFLQAFTLGRRLPRYTPFEIREQIRAAETLGIQSWVLWNPRSVYPREALRPYRTGGRGAGALSGGGE